MFLLILIISGVASLPIINNDVHMAMEHLHKFGYAVENTEHVKETALAEPLKQYQMNMGLNITGHLDRATIDLMQKPRCGMLDTEPQPIMIPVNKTHNIKYSYKIVAYPLGVYEVPFDDEIQGAFDIWSKYTNLLFMTKKRQQQIIIAFYVGRHRDRQPFDGPGNVIAHASDRAMVIHFDADEPWTNSANGTNVYQTAVHEIGHFLGLGHSNNPDSIMYASYEGYKENFRKALHPEDIENVQNIRGKPSNAERGTSQDRYNPLNFNVIFRMNDNTTYIFFDTTYIAYDINMVETERGSITDKWKYLPAKIDAAFQSKTGKVYFFKGTNYWRYTGENMDPTFPISIYMGFPGIKSVDTAVYFNKTVLFFEYTSYYVYKYGEVTMPEREINSHWPGVPNYINSIININDSQLYFFQRSYYFIFDVATNQTKRHHICDFLNCSK